MSFSARNLLFIFYIFTVTDYLTSIWILSMGGKELNPLLTFIFEGSRPALYGLIYKIFTAIWIYGIYYYFVMKNKEDSIKRILVVVNSVYALGILNNVIWSVYLLFFLA